MAERVHLEHAVLGRYVAQREARVVERVRVDVGNPERVPVDRDALFGRVLVLDVGPGPELHRVEVLAELVVGDVLVLDQLGVHLQLVRVVRAVVAGKQLRGGDVSLLAGGHDRISPQTVLHLRRSGLCHPYRRKKRCRKDRGKRDKGDGTTYQDEASAGRVVRVEKEDFTFSTRFPARQVSQHGFGRINQKCGQTS